MKEKLLPQVIEQIKEDIRDNYIESLEELLNDFLDKLDEDEEILHQVTAGDKLVITTKIREAFKKPKNFKIWSCRFL
jgi:flagellar biosynthesis regulator FlbT